MRRFGAVMLVAIAVGTFTRAQQPQQRRVMRDLGSALSAEMAIEGAMERFADEKKRLERDLEVVKHLHTADDALADNMQPSAAIQKAYEEVGEAKRLNVDFNVQQGLIKVHEALDDARRSPAIADFGRLRTSLREDALRPAMRVSIRNATRLEEETLAWIKVQELIAAHLKTLSELSGESLRAAQQ